MIQNFDKSLFEIPSRGQHYSQQWLMEELSEEGTETARLHSGQNKDIQDETSERTLTKLMHTLCMYIFFVDLLYNEGMNKATTCKSYGPLTQKLMAVCISLPYLLLPLISFRHSLIHLVVLS